MTLIKDGSQGSDVIKIQHEVGAKEDGKFGPQTEALVVSWQKAHGLVGDGIVGPLTWAKMFSGNVEDPVPHGRIKGIDIYHDDSMKDWGQLIPNGWLFVFMKASENLSADPKFGSYWSAAKGAGLIRGAYHFIHFNGDGRSQAEFFWKQLESHGFEDSDLPPVLDFEKASGNYPASDINIAVEFCDRIEALSGRKPIIYLSRSVPSEMGNPHQMSNWTPWIASYTSSLAVPSVWGDWSFWQYSDAGRVPGVGNACDVDYFNGSLEDLRVFIQKSKK